MVKRSLLLLPRVQKILEELGANIKLARLRRNLTSEQVAERAGIARKTLTHIEQGRPGVGIGHILNVLKVLGLEGDFLLVAKDDELGRKLLDAKLIPRKTRAPKRIIKP
ncbi:MAG: helix-turn-helix transcriptional regulator [Saprospiraceae bacterium]